MPIVVDELLRAGAVGRDALQAALPDTRDAVGVLVQGKRRMATLRAAELRRVTRAICPSMAACALGGTRVQAFSDTVGFTRLVSAMGGDDRLATLMMAIAGENIAVGIAGAAFVAYLSSIVAKGYSAVQYALLSSLTLLVGTLGRGALGQMIEERGYFDVFILTTAIGMFAVLLCIIEWVRQARSGRPQNAPPPDPDAVAAE